MGRLIIRGDEGQPHNYVAPDLFEDASKYADDADLRQYVEYELVKLATANALSVTHALNQRTKLADLAGSVILGHGRDPETGLPTNVRPPRELQRYQVRVKAINGKDINWKIGMEPQGKTIGAPPRVKGRVLPKPKAEEVRYDEQSQDVTLPLDEAWLLLRQQGKYCRHARSQRLRDRFWLVEEVMPKAPKQARAQA